jgi:hypothetical protein
LQVFHTLVAKDLQKTVEEREWFRIHCPKLLLKLIPVGAKRLPHPIGSECNPLPQNDQVLAVRMERRRSEGIVQRALVCLQLIGPADQQITLLAKDLGEVFGIEDGFEKAFLRAI